MLPSTIPSKKLKIALAATAIASGPLFTTTTAKRQWPANCIKNTIQKALINAKETLAVFRDNCGKRNRNILLRFGIICRVRLAPTANLPKKY